MNEQEKARSRDDQTERQPGPSASPYALVRDELDQLNETTTTPPLTRRVSRHGSEQGLSPYASARVQLSQIKESPVKDHFATKPGVQSANGEDPRVVAKKTGQRPLPSGMSQYEQDMEAKRRAAQPGGGEPFPGPTTPADYAVSIALGETEESDDYEARLAAKNAQFSPAQHAAGFPADKKQGDGENLEELLDTKHTQTGAFDGYSQRGGFGNYSYASMNGSFAMDEMAKQKANRNDGEATCVGYDQEVYPQKQKANTYADFDAEKDALMGLADGVKDDGFGAPQEDNPSLSITAHGRINEPGTEYGETQIGGGTGYVDENLAVAVAISPDEEDAFIPAAIEYDPDSKPPLYKNRRFRFYFVAATFLLVAIGVSVALGVTSTQNNSTPPPTPAPTTERESLGILDQLISVVGETSFQDKNSPHSKAGEWLINLDPQMLPPEADNLIQRYLLAVFYYATTVDKNWKSCNMPPIGESPLCNFTKLTQVFPRIEYENITWTRWLSDSHECEWAGVFCDEFNQTRAIELPGQEISGTFPTELALMPYLQSLTFNWNAFYGTLPSELATMKHLLNIELHYNEFTGTVPAEWYSSQALQRVNFAGNYLTGTIPTEIGELSTMKGFFTFENSFTGTIPTEIGDMKFLSFTRWGRNFMVGTMPSEVGKLEKLQEMWMHRNIFTGTLPPEMGNMRDMGDLRLHFNQFSGPIHLQHYEMPQLRRWDLYDCNMTGTISTLIGEMRNLQTFRIRENNFYGTIPSEIGQLNGLDSLWLHKNDLTGTVPVEICALRGPTGITVLDADCGATNGIGPAMIECQLGCCTGCCDSITGFCHRDTAQ